MGIYCTPNKKKAAPCLRGDPQNFQINPIHNLLQKNYLDRLAQISGVRRFSNLDRGLTRQRYTGCRTRLGGG
jgi:hypothetical protein